MTMEKGTYIDKTSTYNLLDYSRSITHVALSKAGGASKD